MGIGDTLNTELTSWGVLAILIVIVLIILNNLNTNVKAQSNLGAGAGSLNETIQSFITTTSTGLAEPKNWVAIFVIALIGFGVIKYVKDN